MNDGVEDLVQQTMMACTRAVGRFRGEASFKTFLLGVARHELLMYLRKHARKHAPLQPLEMSVADVMQSPSQAAAAKSEQELVAQAMRSIPVELQITLELFYWEQHSGAELAEILEVPEGTVRTRLRRARQLLADEVASMERSAGLALSPSTDLDAWAKSLRDDTSDRE